MIIIDRFAVSPFSEREVALTRKYSANSIADVDPRAFGYEKEFRGALPSSLRSSICVSFLFSLCVLS